VATPLLVSFVGGDTGRWRVESVAEVAGEGHPHTEVARLVGPDSGRPAGGARRPVAAHRNRSGVPPGRGAAIAPRPGHGREFDFLTWFEFAPADAGAFEELVGRLRATEEWSYVDREVDIRLAG